MSVGETKVETLVCYCYEVTEEQIRHTIVTAQTRTLEEICRHTQAGGGCTACHCRLRRMLAGLPARSLDEDLCDTCERDGEQCNCHAR